MPRTFALVISLFCCTAAAAIDDVPPATPVVPRVQTAASVQDAASDVAIWVHPTDPGRSLVIGAGGTAGLETFRLDGASVQRLPTPQVDLVDVRHGVALQDRTVDVVLAVDVSQARLHFLAVEPATGFLAPLGGEPIALGTEVTGLCSYHSPVTGKL